MADRSQTGMTNEVEPPVGALAMLKERVQRDLRLNEFIEPSVLFSLSESVQPSRQWDEGVKTIVELRIGASYTVFRTDKENGFVRQRENAYHAMASLLYQDVLRDLQLIIKTIGDGKRRDGLDLLSDLYKRLRS